MVNMYGINLFYFFNSYTKDVIIYILKVFWSRYQCGYGPKDYQKNSTHTRFIKRGCLASFLIKHLYTQPYVIEIIIYHKAHTRIDESFAHGEHDPESISRMSCYAPHMSQTLKDHIWAQLSLGYTTKQIYDKHKAIWWERVVATLALGSRLRQGVARLRAKRETQEHFTCSRECKECEGMNPHTPKWTPMLGIGVLRGLPNF
jgi:hypothetical protein